VCPVPTNAIHLTLRNQDPLFAMVRGRNGKLKKVDKKIPDYIPKHDAEVLARAKKRAYKLDMSIRSSGCALA